MSTTKRIFDQRTEINEQHVPNLTTGQRHLKFGPPGVGANVEEPISDYHQVPDKDEVNIHGEGISVEAENRNLAELKSLSTDYARKESKEGTGPHFKTQAAIAASTLGKYAAAIGQERLKNPTELIRDLPHIDDVDKKTLLDRLKEEVKTRQAVEMKEMHKEVRGGVAAHVQSTVDKLEQLI
ncbi:17712_t:CDS:2 [Funneliformis geosporum]|uniref:3462_t:CDS:1 n=1 Tax=Funneliformis geosporum TaxID=1117311 RepID=A0A9W4SJC8_9GLOM|nr:17712_t:CDS:2 [Funneliformis geosporum]CAI2170696.1 3462_t:CDS:2 [Funneliformis geosporum]